MIRNIVFDMGQVLLHWQPKQFTALFHLSPEDEEQLIREVFTREWHCIDEGTISEDEAVAAIFSRLPERLHDAAEQVVRNWWKLSLLPMEGMEELIGQLKGMGYGIYLLSNAGVNTRKYFHKVPGSIYFDGRYISAEHKLVKPDPAIFRDFLATFALKAEECFFIDDRPDNIAAAAAEGISGTVYKGTVEKLRAELQHEGILK